jgi:thymidylate synthase
MTGWQYPDFAESFRQGVPCYKKIDQTKWLIDSIKTAPDRKSYVVQAWNPVRLYAMAKECGNASVVLAACHYSHQVIIQGGLLHLIVNIRSNDLPLGNPFNTVQYGLLAHMYAKCLGYPAAELTLMIGDGHCYSDQVGGVIEQIEKPINDLLPTLTIEDRGQQYLTDFKYSDFKVHNYFPEESIRMPLTIVGGF